MEITKGIASNICCLGVDYVGVITSCIIAHKCPSVNVVVIDFDPKRISLWNTRPIPSREPGLEEIVRKNLNKNLIFTSDLDGAIQAADIIFLSRNSPMYLESTEEEIPSDIMEIEKAARFIAQTASKNKIIVEKSTVPVGCTQLLKKIFEKYKKPNVEFQFLSNPEFYSTGSAVENLLNPDRVLIGSDQSKKGIQAANTLASVYAQWVPVEKIITMKAWSAELSKLAVNAFLSQRLTSVNALAILCEAVGANLSVVTRVMGESSDMGPKYLQPSICLGGSHLRKDLHCLIYMCEKLDLSTVADYWRQVLQFNEFHKKRFKRKIQAAFFNNLKNKKIAIWGFTFKKDTQFAEDSPAIDMCKCLLEEGAKVTIYDPKLEKRHILEALEAATGSMAKEALVCDDPYKAALKSNAIVCCTDWDEFKTLNYASIYKEMMTPPRIFDGRNCLPHEKLIKLGFEVESIGKNFKAIDLDHPYPYSM